MKNAVLKEGTKGAGKTIIFDDHTDHSKIELLYYVDTRIGHSTCMAKCEFCWLDRAHSANFKQDIPEALRIIKSLRANDYKVSPVVSDSFAEGGLYLREGLFRNNEDWQHGDSAWSSGRPLLNDNWEELLWLCIESGLKAIVLTSHGTENKSTSFRGITQPQVVREAVRRIHDFNARHGQDLRITLTFTIGKGNSSPAQIKSYFEHCEELGASIIRFNQFADFQQTFPEHRLSKEDIAGVYRTLKEVYNEHQGKVTMSVSEDFGFWGVEVMGFPPEVGHCVAGENFFGVIYPYVYACPVNLTLVVGKIEPDGRIGWNQEMLDRVLDAKKHTEFSGCMAVSYAHNDEIREQLAGQEIRDHAETNKKTKKEEKEEKKEKDGPLVQLRVGRDLRQLAPIGADAPTSLDIRPMPTRVSRAM